LQTDDQVFQMVSAAVTLISATDGRTGIPGALRGNDESLMPAYGGEARGLVRAARAWSAQGG
jgi:hypothetical protein